MERVGPWALKGQLGVGGMGAVYLAERHDGTVAALKVIREDYASDPAFRVRFAREVDACSRVQGPRVAEMVDADTKAAFPWLALRYVPGPTLAHHVSTEGPLTADGTQALAVGLADALAAIWSADVVHRDLKPSNVILTPGGPVLIDFGIAVAAEATSITATGAVVGSAGWMAPEQLRGSTVSEATDVWGWGALVLYAATGTGPFGHGPPEALAWRTLHTEPDADRVTQLPSPLQATVTQALAANPHDRPEPTQLPTLAAANATSDTPDAAVTELGRDQLVTRLWDLPHVQAPPLHSTTIKSPAQPLPHHRQTRRRRQLIIALSAMLVAASVISTLVAITLTDDSGDDLTTTADVDEPPPSSTTLPPVTEIAEPAAETETTPPTTVTTTTTVPLVEATDFSNHTYAFGCSATHTFTLVNGQSPAGPGEPQATLIEAHRFDFNDDGTPDAVVHLRCTTGGTLVEQVLIAFRETNGTLSQVGPPRIISGFFIRTDDHTYEQYSPIYNPDEARCCPSTYERSSWTVDIDTPGVFTLTGQPEVMTAEDVPFPEERPAISLP